MNNSSEDTLCLKRIQICDIMMACTGIVLEAREELSAADVSISRMETLEGTIKKWTRLHDELKRQLDEQDAE